MKQFTDIPNLRHLRMVQMIGRLGGVSSASRELSTSQPAVTQAVANIEADIGVPIFERCATGTYPTPVGKQYLRRIDRFFDILDRAIGQVLDTSESGQDRQVQRIDRLITGTQLRALIVTCDQGHVTEIAHEMGMSPASLFRSARTLERVLDKSLFDRTAQGLIPNRTGNFLAREFRRAAREHELAQGEVLLASGEESLEIAVGAMPMAGSHELARATRAFMTAYPRVKVRLASEVYHKLLADLENSRIDMIFGTMRKPAWAEDLVEEPLYLDSYCLVARPEHPLTQLDVITPADVAQYEWVVPQVNTPRRNRIEAIFAGAATQPRFMVETAALTTSRAFLLCSDMLTLMTRSEIKSDLDLGILVSLPCPFVTHVLRKGITTRSDWLPTAPHAAFIECLRAATAEMQSGQAGADAQLSLAS